MTTADSSTIPDVETHGAPLGDARRLAALRATGLLDGVGNPVLDRLTRLASRLLGVPVALVSLVDAERQHFPGMTGLDGWAAAARGTPLSYSFCRHVVATGAPLVVCDAVEHPQVRGNPAVAEFGVRSYAGVPLRTAGGEVLGAFCAIDAHPRAWVAAQLDGLRDLAATAMGEIESCLALRARAGQPVRAAPEPRRRRATHRQPAGPRTPAADPRTERTADARQRLHAQAVALEAQIDAREMALARLAASEARFRALSACSPVGIFQTDASGDLSYVNPRGQQIWQAPEPALLGRGWLSCLHDEEPGTFLARARATLLGGYELEMEFRIVQADGAARQVHGRAAPLRDAAGLVIGAVGTIEDVTDGRRAAAALAESEQRFRTVVETIDQGVLLTDAADRIVYVNGRVAEIAGRAHEELVGERASDVLVAIDGRPALRAWRAQPSDGRLERHEVELRRADGAAVWIEGGGMPYRDAAGRTVGTIGVVADISARKALETELSRQAFEDPLTGLGNRGRFRARADHALKVLRSPDARRPAVLLVDLDEFKTVNDSLGPAAGDRLLTMVAARLLDATRGSDTVARLGGDEFAALLGGVRDEAEAVVVAQRILAALATPFDLDGRDTYLTASVGIAVAHDADGADDLLRNADLALYRAKQLGKGRCERFVPAMHTAAIERLALATELRRAVDEHQLTLHYQPILELCSGRTVGVEALVRWRHPERGLMPPLSFIPLAESTGIILPLGRWVLREACREASGWAAAPGHPAGHVPTVAVNISARQLERPDFVDEVTEALGDSGLAPERLVLEVTESILLADLGSAITRLEALRAVGVRVALDDFGTGYSSLAYLQRLPVDLLKIDRSFTADVTAGGKRAALARIILSLAETLGIRTVAEGVETAEQHAELATLGCHLGQGYLYARPLTATALTTFLSTPAAARGDP